MIAIRQPCCPNVLFSFIGLKGMVFYPSILIDIKWNSFVFIYHCIYGLFFNFTLKNLKNTNPRHHLPVFIVSWSVPLHHPAACWSSRFCHPGLLQPWVLASETSLLKSSWAPMLSRYRGMRHSMRQHLNNKWQSTESSQNPDIDNTFPGMAKPVSARWLIAKKLAKFLQRTRTSWC